MKRLSIACIVVFFNCIPTSFAQEKLSLSIGNFISSQPETDGYVIKTDEATIKLMVYDSDIIRIRIAKGNLEPDFSYAVIQKSKGVFSTIKEETSRIVLSTEALKIVVSKKPFRLAFYTSNDKLLNKDYDDIGVYWHGEEIHCTKKMFANEKFFGLGEKGKDVNRRGNSYTNLNMESSYYNPNSDPLYSSFPFFTAMHDSLMYGIFLDNTYKTYFNMGASTDEEFYSFSASNGELNYYFIGSQGYYKILEKYSYLTGTMKMPPLWALGNQQSRWSYYPDTMVLNLAQTFRERKIPADAIYLDIDYMDQFKVFTWSPTSFPNPKSTLDQLKKLNFHTITIIDPGVKLEKNYSIYEEVIKNNLFVKYPNGKPYIGTVWPGRCVFPDFTIPRMRELWGNSHKVLIENGIEGFWNDMNEPSVWGNSIPELVEFSYEGSKSTLKRARSIYAMQMNRACFDGTVKLLNGKRPFILSRSGYSGMQRYAAMWSGDTESSDAHMFMVVRQLLSMGMSGMPYMGFDVPGFSGNPTGEQFLRWLSIGSFSPLLRNHHCVGTNHTEPWAFGEGVEGSARSIIEQRYKLLPYIYSTFFAASEKGWPICRMLPLDFPFDEKVYQSKYQHQYMFGDNLLVVPVATGQKFVSAYLPQGKWYRFNGNEQYAGNTEVIVEAPEDKIPVFVKESGIVTMQSLVQSTNQKPTDTLTICIYNGSKSNSFTYYEDDGETYNYEKLVCYKREIIFDPENKKITISKKQGSFTSKFKYANIVFFHFNDMRRVTVNGKNSEIRTLNQNSKSTVVELVTTDIQVNLEK